MLLLATGINRSREAVVRAEVKRTGERCPSGFRLALSVNSCSATALYYLGEIDRSANRWPSAAAWYRKALACAPGYTDAYLGLGIVLQETGEHAEAVRALRRAARLNPMKSEAHFQLARALSKAGRAAEAREELQKARELAASSGAERKP